MNVDRRTAYAVEPLSPAMLAEHRRRLAAGADPADVAASIRWEIAYTARGRAGSRAQVAGVREAVAFRTEAALQALGFDPAAASDVAAALAAAEPGTLEDPFVERLRRPRHWTAFLSAEEIPLRLRPGAPLAAVARVGNVDEDALERFLVQRERLGATRA